MSYKRLILYLTLVFYFCYNSEASALRQDLVHSNYYPDTLTVYDTIWVYDTIFEYETVFDTIWIYDTVFLDTSSQMPLTLIPRPTNPVWFNASDYYRKEYLHQSVNNLPHRKVKPYSPKARRSIYYNLKYKWMQRQKAPKPKKKSANFDSQVTLMPMRGKFNPAVLRQGIITYEPYVGISTTQASINTMAPWADSLKKNYSTNTGNDFGLKINYNLYQYGIQTGIGISNLKSSFSYTQINQLIDSVSNWEKFTREQTRIDTVWFLDINKLLQGDTVWIAYPDTITQIITDSVPIYDTLEVSERKKTENSLRYLEIPLIFSYELGYGRHSYVIKSGLINSFLIQSNGKMYDSEGRVSPLSNALNINSYVLNLYLGLGLTFDINEHNSLIFDGFIKYPLMEYNRSPHIKISYTSYGLSLGYRFRF